MVEGGPPANVSLQCRWRGSGAARARGRWRPLPGRRPHPAAAQDRWDRVVRRDVGLCRARGRPARSGATRQERGVAPGGVAQNRVPASGEGVGGARGRERAGPTRSHPEPGRDPAQRRRVLWGRPHGRRGRRGHPPPSDTQTARRRDGRRHDEEPIAEASAEHPPRGGAAAARWAHNPKVGGSNPPPATRCERRHRIGAGVAVSFCRSLCFNVLEQPRRNSFDFRRNHQLLPTRCRIRYRSRLSEALRRMQSARHLALRRLQCGVAAASALRGAIDVACRGPIPVASALRHPRIWNR